uniref:hypothetical protein n=1 Tax=Candidatus Ichthyocystis sparus TaxID=1561004 RepID=UPI001F5F7A66
KLILAAHGMFRFFLMVIRCTVYYFCYSIFVAIFFAAAISTDVIISVCKLMIAVVRIRRVTDVFPLYC